MLPRLMFVPVVLFDPRPLGLREPNHLPREKTPDMRVLLLAKVSHVHAAGNFVPQAARWLLQRSTAPTIPCHTAVPGGTPLLHRFRDRRRVSDICSLYDYVCRRHA
jgi:hypothetical protein